MEGDGAPQVTGPGGTLARRVERTFRRVQEAAYQARITATKS